MSDRELLTWAAKAAGYEIIAWNRDESGQEIAQIRDGEEFRWWNPLRPCVSTDRLGDTLRLALKVKSSLGFFEANLVARIPPGDIEYYEVHDDDRTAEDAVCLAAVRELCEQSKDAR